MRMAALILSSLSFVRDLINHVRPVVNSPKYGLPIPPKPHMVLSTEEIGGRPILIVGDIHGCFDELQELIKKAQKTVNSNDIFLLCVGDMLNKGPKNLEVVRFLRRLSTEGRVAAVRGNHEESLLRENRNLERNPDYVLPPKYEYLSEFSQEDFSYLKNLPYTLRVPQISSLIVHAGMVPGVPLEEQSFLDLAHMRNLSARCGWFLKTRFQGNNKTREGVPWATRWIGPDHIYFGHDALRGLQKLTHATGLDTGCVYGNCLTGVTIDVDNNRHFISVPAGKVYYPPETKDIDLNCGS